MKKYFGIWSSREDTIRDFFPGGVPNGTYYPSDDEIIFAGYWQDGYEASAAVLYTHNGEFFEVRGGHCSCNGLEDQFEHKGEVTAESLRMRPELNDSFADLESRKAWAEVVKHLDDDIL